MKTELPPIVASFFQAQNSGETDNFENLFTDDALVSDEHHNYRGSAIKTWMDRSIANYKPTAEAIAIDHVGDTICVTAQVSGTFPGSPAEIVFRFSLKGGKIAALAIGS